MNRPRLPLICVLILLGLLATLASGCCPVCADDDDATDDDDAAPDQGYAFVPDFTVSTAGAGPCGIAVAQLDDGPAPDLAVSHILSSTMSVLYGVGDGGFEGAWQTFEHLAPMTVGNELAVTSTGNFDGDDHVDLIVVSTGTDEAIILHNPGTSVSEEGYVAEPFGVGEGPFGVTVADFDGDGLDDFAVSGGVSNDVTVYRQTSAGVFAELGRHDVDAEPGFVVAGHVDDDGVVDLVTTNHTGGSVSVLLGVGGGEFGPAVDYPVGDGPAAPALADIDGDGHTDLLTANEDSGDFSILLGDGDGGFTSKGTLAYGDIPFFISAFDVDADDDVDIVVLLEGEDAMVVATNDGEGNFTEVLRSNTGRSPGSLVHPDLDGDGDPDLVVTNFFGDSLSVFLNRFDEL